MSGWRRLFSQATAYTFGLVLIRAGNFLLVPLYVSLLTPEAYGQVGVLQQVVAVLATIALCGQQQAALQLGVRAAPDAESRRRLHSTLWTFVLVAGVGLSVLAAALWPWVLAPIGVEMGPLVVAALVGVGAQANFLLQLAFRQQAGRAREHTLLNLSRWVVLIALSLLFVPGLGWGPLGILLAQSLSYWVGVVLGLPGVKAKEGEEVAPVQRPSFRIDKTTLTAALKLGLPVLPHALAGVAFVTTDRTLLTAHHGPALVGLYTLAANLASSVLLLGQGLHSAWAPHWLRLDQEKDRCGWDTAKEQSLTMVALLALAAGALGLLAPEVIGLLAPKNYADAAWIVPLLAVANFVRGYYQIVVPIVLAEPKASRWLAVTTVPAALLNVLLNAVWIPEHGVRGAVASLVVTYIANAVIAAVLARFARPVPLAYGRATLLLPVLASTLWYAQGQGLVMRLGIGVAFVAVVAVIGRFWATLVPTIRRLRKKGGVVGEGAP